MHIHQLCMKHEVFITFAFQAKKKEREIMKPRVSTKLMGSSSTKIPGLLFLLLPWILRTSAGATITCGT